MKHILIEGIKGSFDDAMTKVFLMGFGPRPMYDRPGVAVRIESEDGSDIVGCVIPHRAGRAGCKCREEDTCYYCPGNPFYEVSDGCFLFRCSPAWTETSVLPVGTPLLLDMECPEFKSKVRPEQLSGFRGIMRANEGARRRRKRRRYDKSGLPVSQRGENGENDDEAVQKTYLSVRLNIPNTYSGIHGKIRVSFAATSVDHRNTEDMRSVYVEPQYLRFVEGTPPSAVLKGILLNTGRVN